MGLRAHARRMNQDSWGCSQILWPAKIQVESVTHAPALFYFPSLVLTPIQHPGALRISLMPLSQAVDISCPSHSYFSLFSVATLVMKPERVAGSMDAGIAKTKTRTPSLAVSLGRLLPVHGGPGSPKVGHGRSSCCGDRQTAGVQQPEGSQGLEEGEMKVLSGAEPVCSQIPLGWWGLERRPLMVLEPPLLLVLTLPLTPLCVFG